MRKFLRVSCLLIALFGVFLAALSNDRQLQTAGSAIAGMFVFLFALLFVKRVF